jgi:endonuclease YncB( thermonuclease family)
MPCRLSRLLLCLLPLFPVYAARADEDVQLWTQTPTRIDRSRQHFERLPAVTTAIDDRVWLAVPPRITIVDGISFAFGDRTYRLGGLRGIGIGRLCQDGQANRWSCGRAASVALNNLVRGKRILCDIDTAAHVAVLTHCLSGNDDVAATLVGLGLARAAGDPDLAAVEVQARQRRVGIWQNPRCAADFDRC